MNNKQILIIGYGNIGKHMYNELQGAGDIDIYDKYIDEYSTVPDKLYDFGFICVPTDMKPDGSCDFSIVESVFRELKNKVKTFVIKSTIPVGCTEYLMHNNSYYSVVFSPEYYGTTRHADPSPNFLVLAGMQQHCEKVAQLYYRVKTKNFRITFTDFKTAELAKYMENCFLGLKVTFCAEFAKIAKQFGISYPELREIFVLDPRMGDSHTFIDPEQPYYDSHCLNKDIPALIKQAGENAPLMTSVHQINLNRKKEKATE
jgi:nucleotide sugar dehydrogenase